MTHRIDWNYAPEWANYAVMNYDGTWFWFEYRPTYDHKRGGWTRKFDEASGKNSKIVLPIKAEDSLVEKNK